MVVTLGCNLQVHICGGRTSNRFQKGVTHIITSSDNNNPCALLQYLFHAGTTSEEMNWLREGLQTGCIWIGSRRWVHNEMSMCHYKSY